MPINIEIPDETIRQVQRTEYLIKNKDKTTNHKFRLQATQRLQHNIQEIVYEIIAKQLRIEGFLKINYDSKIQE